MNKWNFSDFHTLDSIQQTSVLEELNRMLLELTAENRILWGLEYLPHQVVISSSFGVQSVVTLHLMIRHFRDIPVIVIDTGYLFPETYYFIDRLTKEMKLNLQVFTARESSAWQEVRYGKLWEQGIEGINRYNYINKIEPMNRAFKELRVKTWFSGLRYTQSSFRKTLSILAINHNIFKLLPILDWSNDQIHKYIEQYALIRHPLWDKGFISIGDIHSTQRWKLGMKEEDTRYFGLKRECGLHTEDFYT